MATLLPDRDPTILIQKRASLQAQFITLALTVAICGSDADSVEKLESIRAEIQLAEGDLTRLQSDSAA